jgi:hypothetical protein
MTRKIVNNLRLEPPLLIIHLKLMLESYLNCVEKSGLGLIWCTPPACLTGVRKNIKILNPDSGLRTEVWTRDLQSMKQDCYPLDGYIRFLSLLFEDQLLYQSFSQNFSLALHPFAQTNESITKEDFYWEKPENSGCDEKNMNNEYLRPVNNSNPASPGLRLCLS